MKKYFQLLYILFISGIILLPFNLFAQSTKIDSLLTALNYSKDDTNKVNTLNFLGLEFIVIEKYDSALKYSTNAKNLGDKLEFYKGVAVAYNTIGKGYYFLGNYKDALENHFQALAIQEQRRDSESIGQSYNNIGAIYSDQGDYPEAMERYLFALKIFEQTGNKNKIAFAYNNIATIYSSQENYPEALKYFFQTLDIARQVNNKDLIASSYDNIAAIYDMQSNYSLALENALQGLKIYEETGDTIKIAYNFSNIGSIYSNGGNYEDALKNYFKALKIWEKNGDRLGVAISYSDIGDIFTKQKKFNDAKSYLLDGLKISKEIGAKDVLKDCYNNLAILSEAIGDYKNAYEYQNLFSEVKDSLLNESNSRQIAEMKTKYETEKKEREIQLLSKDKEMQKRTIRFLIGGLILVIIFTLIYFRIYSQKKKTFFKHQVMETEMKALRSQMNPHFTFNVLNSIQYYVNQHDMESAELYLEKFSRLIRMILDQSRKPYISLEQEIAMLNIYLEMEKMLYENKFAYLIEIDKSLALPQTMIPGMLIQPVVENAIKHGIAYKEGESLINIAFSQRNSTLLCTITDNGIGRTAAEKLRPSDKHSSSGVTIIKERMEALSSLYNIPLSYHTEDLFDAKNIPAGTRVSIELPIKSS